MEPSGHKKRDRKGDSGLKREAQEFKSGPIGDRRLSQEVKSIHTIYDFAVCTPSLVAEIRK